MGLLADRERSLGHAAFTSNSSPYLLQTDVFPKFTGLDLHLTHVFTYSLHHPVAAAVNTEQCQGMGPAHSTPRPPGSSPSWSNLCSLQSADEFCTVLLFQIYPHWEYSQACRFRDAHCSSGYKVSSHLKRPGIHPLCFAVFLTKIIKLPPNKMQWNEMESGYCP